MFAVIYNIKKFFSIFLLLLLLLLFFFLNFFKILNNNKISNLSILFLFNNIKVYCEKFFFKKYFLKIKKYKLYMRYYEIIINFKCFFFIVYVEYQSFYNLFMCYYYYIILKKILKKRRVLL